MKDIHALDELARSQVGLVERGQLRRLGWSDADIDRAIAEGWLLPHGEGVFRTAGTPCSFRQELMAACLIAGRAAVVSHRAAAHVWDIELGVDVPPEITVPRSSSARTPGVVVHRPRVLPERHVTERSSLPITTPARTLVDLGWVVDQGVVASALEQFLVRRMVGRESLLRLCEAMPGKHRRGPRTLEAVLLDRPFADGPGASALESALGQLCRKFGIPMPEFQFVVELPSGRRRLDFAYPDLWIAIEVDGWAEHLALDKFSDDRVRANELVAAGWTVLRFTWHQVVADPHYVARTILGLLATRSAA